MLELILLSQIINLYPKLMKFNETVNLSSYHCQRERDVFNKDAISKIETLPTTILPINIRLVLRKRTKKNLKLTKK